ncbi:DUF3545 family protein [Gallaecimonas sp. GXIMD1310]|uniref:DUF3545 family protein n=1 Tax=Gallaecimonas sp. GXIMD1310 TaxID=3131926 RepID=UPI0032517B2D
MDDLQQLQAAISGEKEQSKGRSNKKRRWREIETLKEKYRLKRELEDLDWSTDYDLDAIDL